MKAKKSAKRIEIISKILSLLSSPDIFNVVDPHTWNEERIQTYMHKELSEGMIGIFESLYPSQQKRTIEKKAIASLNWSGDIRKTIHNLPVMGVLHRPDFEININDIRIAVEVKLGDDGSSVREGIGQCVLYSVVYDFVIYVLVDATEDFSIRESLHGQPEQFLVSSLWDIFNIRLQVV